MTPKHNANPIAIHRATEDAVQLAGGNTKAATVCQLSFPRARMILPPPPRELDFCDLCERTVAAVRSDHGEAAPDFLYIVPACSAVDCPEPPFKACPACGAPVCAIHLHAPSGNHQCGSTARGAAFAAGAQPEPRAGRLEIFDDPGALCEDCSRGLKLSADGSNHIFGEGVGDVRACRAAFNGGSDLTDALGFAQTATLTERVGFVIYKVRDGAGVTYKVRRKSLALPFNLFRSKWEEVTTVEVVKGATAVANPYPEGSAIQVDEAAPAPFIVHAARNVSDDASESVAMACGKKLLRPVFTSRVPTGEAVEDCPGCKEEIVRASSGERFVFAVENYPDPNLHVLLTTDRDAASRSVVVVCSCGRWGFTARAEEDEGEEELTAKAGRVHAEHLRSVARFERPACVAPGCKLDAAASLLKLGEVGAPGFQALLCPLCKQPLCYPHSITDPSQHDCPDNEATQRMDEPTKREQILSLYDAGTTEVADIVRQVKARPSYVAQVLQSAGLLEGFFDLYTTTAREQNVYTRYFRNVLAFRNVEAARESVARIDRLYNYFERLGDRAGQHQAMVLALLGKNRARWSGKLEESAIFSEWLNSH